MTPPEPGILPTLLSPEMSIVTSISLSVKTGVEEPPGITAFNFLSPEIPPPKS